MKSHEALEVATNKIVNDVAKRLGLSTSLIYKWREPHSDYTDSGARNPLDLIEIIIETAQSHGLSTEESMAPVQCLAERFSHILIPLPPIASDTSTAIRTLHKTVKEFSDFLGEASKSLSDGEVTAQEYKKVKKEAWELIRQAAMFVSIIKATAK